MVKGVSIFMAGVGGQGVILISEILGETAVREGLSVRTSDVLGMAVRGGQVISTVRIGEELYGPLLPQGKADLMMGLEPAETLRNIAYLSKSGVVLLNTQKMIPPLVFLGLTRYPELEEIIDKLKKNSSKVITFNTLELAKQAGSVQSSNIVMLGAALATGLIPLKREAVEQTVVKRLPKVAEVNLRAFELGYETCRRAISQGFSPK